jgi:acylphosphatase
VRSIINRAIKNLLGRGFGFESRWSRLCHTAMAEVQHETVHFTGHVQGVGFRYQTLQVAKGFDVSGYVRNLPDGRVQLEAEGDLGEVSAFLSALEEQLGDYIRRTERQSERRAPQFRGFTIR